MEVTDEQVQASLFLFTYSQVHIELLIATINPDVSMAEGTKRKHELISTDKVPRPIMLACSGLSGLEMESRI